MTFTMRRERRDEVGRQAWLDLGNGGPIKDCMLIDISSSGAKLEVDDVAGLPDTFALRLKRRGYPSSSCRVVWRSATAVGVEFT